MTSGQSGKDFGPDGAGEAVGGGLLWIIPTPLNYSLFRIRV